MPRMLAASCRRLVRHGPSQNWKRLVLDCVITVPQIAMPAEAYGLQLIGM